jgi:hypothetical protein|tara:strand:+ start:2766 stop:3272 length:507 start_codon:yes stop_codon:yes gene_type:complete
MQYVSAGRVYRIPAPVRRDLHIIKNSVEKELKTPIRGPKERRRRHVNAKRVFIALVLYVYNVLQRELKSSNTVTLAALAAFMRYKSHSSISLHLIDSNKGYRSLLDSIRQDDKLWLSYRKLKLQMNVNHNLPFRRFLEDKKDELEHEITIINRYLNLEYAREKKEGSN